jgi:5-methylcytosine-specific restriction endonuclease McrA
MNVTLIKHVKLCKACNQEKPISEFRLRKSPNNKRSYGRCLTCERTYDYFRRRQKGISIITLKKDKPTPLILIERDATKHARVYYMLNRLCTPTHNKVCKECSASFKGYSRAVFCTTKCGDKYYRRIRKKKERARMRILKADNVDPIKVFEQHQWHCAHCNVYTPRHLKGKQHDDSPELDHIIPLSKGGLHAYNNVQLLCRRCNSIKSDRITLKLTG